MIAERLLQTIDTHVFGEAYRIVVQAPIGFDGTDVQANQQKLWDQFEDEKQLLLNEPRGHRGMNGCLVEVSEDADYQLLSFHHQAAIPFKYEALLAVTAALIEMGHLKPREDNTYKVETVKGIFSVKAFIEQQQVSKVSIQMNGKAKIEQDAAGVKVSLEDGHTFYLAEKPENIPSLQVEHVTAVGDWGLAKVQELKDRGIQFDGVILLEEQDDHICRSVTFEKDGYILRSPGIESTMAIMAVKKPGGPLTNESIFSSRLTINTLPHDEGICSVKGGPYITGSHEFILDPEDPLKQGFIIA